MYRGLFFLFFCVLFYRSAGQNPAGYWLSDNRNGFFEGIENMEIQLNLKGAIFSGDIYYIWEHGLYYQDISLTGHALPGDSVELTEVAMVANRNGNFPGDCKGVFHLRYSRDDKKEYLKGIWKKPPGSTQRCPDTKVTFFRMISGKPPAMSPATPLAISVPDPDSVRWQSFKTRKDSLELTLPHHADTIRLELYDDGIIDHDRISLYLGDSLILKNYELLARPLILSVVLDTRRKDNTLSLYAENEGDIPPNTALMVIYVDDQRYDVRLSSDMKTNAKVVFQKLP
jgi:hypothetical protein